MKFNAQQMAFGRHETFALRYGWLSKGYQAISTNPSKKVFESDDATVAFGVGKNMVNSIRHWMKACQIIDEDTYQPTDIGRAIFSADGYDPYLEDEATIWLIHWLLVTSPQLATAWYWFFNCFHRPRFTVAEAQEALKEFISKHNTGKRTSEKTLERDIQLLIRMYTQSKLTDTLPAEELFDSPLSTLDLIKQTADSKVYVSKPESRNSLPLDIFGFAVAQVMSARQAKYLPIEDLMYSDNQYPALGSAFRMTEESFMAKLEKLATTSDSPFEARETAGIHQIYNKQKNQINPIRFLKSYYQNFTKAEQYEPI